VLQGERELAKDCRSLGRFRLSGLPPMPAGAPQIDVTFLLDASGMLQVTAAEARSGKAAAIDVQPSYGLDRGEVDRLVRESVEHAREDFTARRLVELRNRAEGDLRHAEKALERVGERLDSARRAEIESARAVLDSVRSGDDLPALQAAVDRFDVATRPLAEILMGATLAAEAERAASDAH
ncbi:MAG TPA: Hsp70 family protein, partial [Planctomycetia bacterium]|nr:Hsp70 family protein [Planctomycetia bacterium]